MFSNYRTILLLLGVIAIFSIQNVFAAPPRGFKWGDWTVQNGTITPNEACPESSLGCGVALSESGFFQREVRDSAGNYYYQTIIVDESAAGDPRNSQGPSDSDNWVDPGVNFWNETFVKIQYNGYSNNNGVAIYQYLDYDGVQDLPDYSNPTGPPIKKPTQHFENTFEIVTGDLYEEQFGTPDTGKYPSALSISQTIRGYDTLDWSDTRGELMFQTSFGLEKDTGHQHQLIAISQDVAIGEIGEAGGSLSLPENDRQMFRHFSVDGAVGSGYIGFDTDLNGTSYDVFLKWEDGDKVEFTWIGQEQSYPDINSGISRGIGEFGYYSYEVTPYYPHENGGKYSVINYFDSSPNWFYYPPNENPYCEPGDNPFDSHLADPNFQIGWNNFQPNFVLDWF